MPRLIANEVLAKPLDEEEQQTLEAFLNRCTIIAPSGRSARRGALSEADYALLHAAQRLRVHLALVDEKALRHALLAHGVPVMGTLGIFVRAVETRRMQAKEAQHHIDQLMQLWDFRIAATTYQAFRQAIASGR